MADVFGGRHRIVEETGILIQQLTAQWCEAESAGQSLTVHLAAENSNGDQPSQILFERIGMAWPTPGAPVAAPISPEARGIKSTVLEIPVELKTEGEAPHRSLGPLPAALAQQVARVRQLVDDTPSNPDRWQPTDHSPGAVYLADARLGLSGSPPLAGASRDRPSREGEWCG
jgi:hypothetical protein